jgi:predicted ATPase
MTTITIKNIGPIKDVTLDLNKVNIIMGPQSSGKSTIAKIISYCQWVEKRYILDGEFNYVFSEKFMDFHRISEVYFNADSLIWYKSNVIEITYSGNKNKQKIKKINRGIEFINHKNIYIPAERNFVSVIPNLGKYIGKNDNIMNFLYDWYEVKEKYVKENKFSILNLGISYYHIKITDSDVLILNEEKKELLLNNASSGLQSVLPMLILIDYLTQGLFSEKTPDSFDEKKETEEMINIFSKYFIKDVMKKIGSDNNNNKILVQYEKEKKVSLSFNEIDKIIKLVQSREYNYSQFIIEEPEQNLFPEAQRDLVFYLLNRINNDERDHKLLITTHSPYVLYALNNCMMGYLIKDIMPKDEQKTLLSKQSWINPKVVSIWEIKDGQIFNTQGEDGLIGKNYFDTSMKRVMDDFYSMLNYYGDEE